MRLQALQTDTASILLAQITNRTSKVGVIGMGYVGLPLAIALTRADFPVIGFDVDTNKVEKLKAGKSYFRHISDSDVRELANRSFDITDDLRRLGEVDVIVACVPTPLSRHREPDLTYIEATASAISQCLRPGQLISFESTTYPGTTQEVIQPILDQSGLTCGRDYFLAYSPEREDPGNADFTTTVIPKVVGADGAEARRLAETFYSAFVSQVVTVRDTRTAEAVKLTENIFRAVNIAMANELKEVYGALGVDVWDVIDAAKTKPFGFMPFYPGPGLGGHCIPIDPFYLTWKAREHGVATRFIELAGEINTAMPRLVVEKLAQALDARQTRAVKGSRVLVLGLAYKKNVDDVRESPTFPIIARLREREASVVFHDPFVSAIPPTREHPELTGENSVSLTVEEVEMADVVLIATDHDNIDYALVNAHAKLIVDTRNAMARHNFTDEHIVKA